MPASPDKIDPDKIGPNKIGADTIAKHSGLGCTLSTARLALVTSQPRPIRCNMQDLPEGARHPVPA